VLPGEEKSKKKLFKKKFNIFFLLELNSHFILSDDLQNEMVRSTE